MKFAASLVLVIVTLAIVSAFDVDFLPEVCKYLVIQKRRNIIQTQRTFSVSSSANYLCVYLSVLRCLSYDFKIAEKHYEGLLMFIQYNRVILPLEKFQIS